MFRDFGHPRPAELWLNRAIRVARWNGDVETHDLALNSLGNLFCQQGCYREAERHLTRALHVAAALDRARRGCVSHDLMAVSIALEDFSRAEDFASAAVRLYGPDHPNLPRLGFDIAVLWIRQGKFAAAFPVLQALSSRLTSVNERLHVLGATARTAGALGDREAFLTAWRDVWTQLATGGPESRMASAEIVLDLALGAAALHDAERARSAFEEAIREAQATKQLDVAAHAEAGLQALRAGEHFGPIARPASTPAANLSKAVTYALAVGSSFTVGLNCGGRST
jgi:tetratricopeptide (TPR) repeat protein